MIQFQEKGGSVSTAVEQCHRDMPTLLLSNTETIVRPDNCDRRRLSKKLIRGGLQ